MHTTRAPLVQSSAPMRPTGRDFPDSRGISTATAGIDWLLIRVLTSRSILVLRDCGLLTNCLLNTLKRGMHRQNLRAGFHRILDHPLKQSGRATVAGRRITDIVRGKDQPAAYASIRCNDPADGIKVFPAVLDKKSLEVIQIRRSGIESLAPAPGTFVMTGDPALRFRSRPAQRI